jgi:hypothetical protein
MGHERVGFDRAFMPEYGPETPRVAQPEAVLACRNFDVVPGAGCRPALDNAQAARHAKVDNQRAVIESEEKVLGASLDLPDGLANESLLQVGWYRPAQTGIAYGDRSDTSPFEQWGEATASDFDFGQFGHEGRAARRSVARRGPKSVVAAGKYT